MARKKSVSNQSARREEIVDYDVKRLRQMSAKELQDYYDRVEPISDDEVNAIYDRVMPKIAYEIASDNQQKKPRHIGSSIKKTVLVAVCMTLMLSVVAQALGIPVWETFVTWTKENLRIYVTHSNTAIISSDANTFSEKEIATWGNDVYEAFSDIGVYPALPEYMPKGFHQFDLYYMTDDYGYSYFDVLFMNDEEITLNLVIDLFTSDSYSYETVVEYDQENVEIITIDGITYNLVSNMSSNTVSWCDQNGSYSILGTIDLETLEQMIRSIKR